jgi:hypothetical protein
MIYLAKAIKNLRPTSQFSYDDDDYSTINWIVLDGDAPTKKEIDDEIKRMKAEEIAQEKSKAIAKSALLDKLGITEDEAKLLLS